MTIHRPFSIVLGGGGARGFPHVGVLRALERERLRPSGIVGVSTSAVVGATYAHRFDWYEVLLAMDLSAFPGPTDAKRGESSERFSSARRAVSYLRLAKEVDSRRSCGRWRSATGSTPSSASRKPISC